MLFIDETTLILNLLEVSNANSWGGTNGGFVLLIMALALLTLGAGIVTFFLGGGSYYLIKHIDRLTTFEKVKLVVCSTTSITTGIITCYLGFCTYLLASSDHESILRYANFRYIKYVKNDPNVDPEIKTLIEKYLKGREAQLNRIKEMEIKRRFGELADKVK